MCQILQTSLSIDSTPKADQLSPLTLQVLDSAQKKRPRPSKTFKTYPWTPVAHLGYRSSLPNPVRSPSPAPLSHGRGRSLPAPPKPRGVRQWAGSASLQSERPLRLRSRCSATESPHVRPRPFLNRSHPARAALRAYVRPGTFLSSCLVPLTRLYAPARARTAVRAYERLRPFLRYWLPSPRYVRSLRIRVCAEPSPYFGGCAA